jgi:hypothetical protein
MSLKPAPQGSSSQGLSERRILAGIHNTCLPANFHRSQIITKDFTRLVGSPDMLYGQIFPSQG